MTDKNDQIEAEIQRTGAIVEQWKERAGSIHTQIATATGPLMSAEAERVALAQAFASGDLKAGDKLKKLRQARVEAEAEVADLQLALSHAETELRAAEAEHLKAVKLRDIELARDSIRARIQAAEEVDVALKALSVALDHWEETAGPLLHLDVPAFAGRDLVSRVEAVTGPKRLGNASAAVVDRLFPYLGIKPYGNGTPLAASERALWHSMGV